MIPKGHRTEQYVLLSPSGVGLLIQVLIRKGYEVIGPTIYDGAIVYDRVSSVKDLPAGWTDEQQGGKYQPKRRSDNAIFG